MNYTKSIAVLAALLPSLLFSCQETNPVGPDGARSTTFEPVAERFPMAPGRLDEASGMVASRTLPQYLWVHNDGNNPVELFLMSYDAKTLRSVPVPRIINRDWEDIAVGGGPDDNTSYVYIGDIGNNDGNPDVTVQYIYRVPEVKSLDGSFDANAVATIAYRYPDGSHDAETLLCDPITKDIFIATKELGETRLYRLPYPQATQGITTAELVGKIPSVIVATGGDISADGQEIIIRTYTSVHYWQRNPGELIGQTLTRAALKLLPYEIEPQGEAICFDRDMKGYFTTGERRSAPSVNLSYYRRK